MNLTSIFRLRKPEGTDPVNVEDFNDNFDVIDTELNKRPEKTGNASDMVTTFSQAASRANLPPGEKISVSFGKIMKFFAALKAVAFTGRYADLSNKPSIPGGAAASQAVANNCTTTAAGSVLDARQGKVLMDKANQINSDLGTCRFGITADGRPGYKKAGADTVYPFSNFTDVLTIQGVNANSATKSLPAGTYQLIYESAVYSRSESCPVVSVYVNGALKLQEKNIIESGSTDDSDYTLAAGTKTLVLSAASNVYLNIAASGKYRPYATAVLFRIS